jgi:ribonuclease HII
MITKKIELVVEHKADLNNTIVGAASILAKVTRDGEIEKLKKIAKQDFGSGYPADPKTVEFLKKNYDKFDFFRTSWATYKNVAGTNSTNKSKQKGLGDY